MRARRLLALVLVLALAGSAMALQQRKLYRMVTDADDFDPQGRGLVLVQQHAVFAEIILEERSLIETYVHFAAVVGLVKKCKQTRNMFDNAVLWFNDQFLFGNKSNRTVNVTPPDAMGQNPNRTLDNASLADRNRNNGTGAWNASTNGAEVNESGTGAHEGGNPDRDGFVRARDDQERWGGCFIPRGFMHAIATDDPYGTGSIARANASVGPTGTTLAEELAVTDHIEIVKRLIDLDHTCEGCVFEFAASYFVTDPNNHRWIVDKLVYPVALVPALTDDDLTDCHFGPTPRNNTTLPFGGDCSLRTDQPGSYENQNVQSKFEPLFGPETDKKGDERLKFTTKEPIYTVHVQVDPWNPDRQGFPDEAIWAYREDGRLRLGMPYSENITDGANGQRCHDDAELAGSPRYAPMAPGGGTSLKPDAYEYDLTHGEGGPAPKGSLATAPGNGSLGWTEFRRGPVGNTVECAIEYNFLLAVDFEAFDNTNPVSARASAGPVAWANASSQEEGTGENEIFRRAKEHGTGGADEADRAWQGNSHPHNPADCHPPPSAPGPCDPGPKHVHDALVLDLFFYERAPYFVETNPYWDHANETDALMTTGTPPRWDNLCTTAPDLPVNDYRRRAIEARGNSTNGFIAVCDTDAVDGFHLHDGTQTIPLPPQQGGPTQARVEAGPGGVSAETGPNGPNPSAP